MAYCSRCGHLLKYRDTVKRKIKSIGGTSKYVQIPRFKCTNSECRSIYRELPDYILPFKQYEADIIEGVLDGFITSDTLGFEDYPSEITMKRWLSWFEAISKSATVSRTDSGWLRIFVEKETMFVRKDRNVPCLNCDHRDEGCHSTCPDYQEWAEARRQLNEYKKKAKVNDYLVSKYWHN